MLARRLLFKSNYNRFIVRGWKNTNLGVAGGWLPGNSSSSSSCSRIRTLVVGTSGSSGSKSPCLMEDASSSSSSSSTQGIMGDKTNQCAIHSAFMEDTPFVGKTKATTESTVSLTPPLSTPWSIRQALSALEKLSIDSDDDDHNKGRKEDDGRCLNRQQRDESEEMSELRIRAATSLFKSLSEVAKSAMEKSITTSHQARSFSSSSSSSSSTTLSSSTNKDNEEIDKKPPQPKGSSTTEPDFAEYLAGSTNIDETLVPPTSSASFSTTFTTASTTSTASPPPFKIQKSRFIFPDLIPSLKSQDSSEAYRNIRLKQHANIGIARAKTAANVRRALGGNMVICAAKLGAYMSSGSSSMLSEFIHSVVDCGNQSLLLIGLKDATNVPDRKHPYGYGKSVYFWALVSALGTFFLGAGISMTHSVGEVMDPSLQEVTWQVWSVLGLSLAVDGYVFGKTILEIKETQPPNKSLYAHISDLRDPATLAILLEDGAACLGVVMALAGISAAHVTGMPVFDAMAGVGISALLATMGLVLVRVNHRFLLGQAVDREITEGIEKILRSQPSIDNVQSVQSQWTSSETFSYKAEVDFDGTFLAAKLMPRYQHEFLKAQDSLDEELWLLLSWYAEDVIRTVEREVRDIEAEIRKKYPGAEYIELEPMSKDSNRFAIDDGMEAQLKRIELEALNRYLKSLYQPPSGTTDAVTEKESKTPSTDDSDLKR